MNLEGSKEIGDLMKRRTRQRCEVLARVLAPSWYASAIAARLVRCQHARFVTVMENDVRQNLAYVREHASVRGFADESLRCRLTLFYN